MRRILLNMSAYGIGNLHDVERGPAVAEYLERIDGTLAPYGGRFIVHGGRPDVREGRWDGTLIIIEFPDLDRARAWYESPEYQAILPLRTEHSRGDVLLIDGVEDGHKATDVLR